MHADTRPKSADPPMNPAKENETIAKTKEDTGGGNPTVPMALPPATASWLCRHLCLCCPALHYFSLRCRSHPARPPVVACAASSTAATVGGNCSAGGFYVRFVCSCYSSTNVAVPAAVADRYGRGPRLRGVTGTDIWPGDCSPPLLITGGGNRSPSCGRDRWPDMPPSISVGIDFEIGLSNVAHLVPTFSLESKEDTESQTWLR